MNIVLSDKDITKIAGYPARVLTHNDLIPVKNIESLLSPPDYSILLLYEYLDKVGHWTCILAHPSHHIIEFFDPLGLKPDDQKEFIPSNRWMFNKLSHLLYDAATRGWKIDYNEIAFQKDQKSVTTCGRWVGFRLRNQHLILDTFQNYVLNSFSQSSYPSLDHWIVAITDTLF